MSAAGTVRVLMVEDNETDAALIQRALNAANLAASSTRVDTIDGVRAALRDQTWDIVLFDFSLPGFNVGLVIELAGRLAPTLPIVVVTGAVGEEAIVDLMRLGIADVVLKDRLSPRLAPIVQREVARSRESSVLDARRRRGEAMLAAFTAASDWRNAVETCLQDIGSSLRADLALMWEATSPDVVMQPIATWHTAAFAALGAALQAFRVPAEQTLVGKAVLYQEAVVVECTTDPAHPSTWSPLMTEARRHGIAGLACYPFEVGGRRFGLTILFSDMGADLHTALAELEAVSVSMKPILFRRLIENDRKLLRDALDATRSGVMITEATPIDPPGPRIMYANRAVSKMTGYDPGELLGDTPRILQGPETDRATLDVLRRALLAAEPISVELINYRNDQTPFLVELDVTPVHNDGQVTHFISIQTDVTERRLAEQERRDREEAFRETEFRAAAELREAKTRAEQAEALLRDAIDSMSEGFVIYDRDDRFVMCNAAYKQIYSQAADILVPGLKFEDFVRRTHAQGGGHAGYEEDQEKWFELRLKHHREGTGELEYLVSNGTWVRVTDRRMRNGGSAGLRVDITSLKKAQQELSNSEARLDRAQQIAGIGSWELDISNERYTWSRELYRLRGLSADTFQPTIENILPYIHPDDSGIILGFMDDLKAGVPRDPIEFRNIRPDGSVFLARVEGRPVVGPNGTIRAIAGTFQDITERRLIERQLAQSQRMEAIGSLTAGISHDFNNMLAIITVNLELAIRQLNDRPETAELCAEALDGAKRCADLIQRLLAFARRQPLHPEQTDANALITNLSHLLQRTLGETIELKLDLDTALWPVLVDPAQLEAVLVNFATNSRDAMPKGGRLEVTTRNTVLDDAYAKQQPDVRPGEYIQIEVADTGMGIDPDTIVRVFEPFFTTKAKGGGTGLGLSMAFGFAKQSGGHLSIYSEVNLGTAVRLYLPRSNGGRAVRMTKPITDDVVNGVESILVVEDNARLRHATLQQLRVLGYQVREAENADVALAILSGTDPVDILFTDVVMPGTMDGLELAQEAARLRPGLAIVLASGFPALRGSHDRAANFHFPLLRKPYRLSELSHALREALRVAKTL